MLKEIRTIYEEYVSFINGGWNKEETYRLMEKVRQLGSRLKEGEAKDRLRRVWEKLNRHYLRLTDEMTEKLVNYFDGRIL